MADITEKEKSSPSRMKYFHTQSRGILREKPTCGLSVLSYGRSFVVNVDKFKIKTKTSLNLDVLLSFRAYVFFFFFLEST